jgi:Phage ABA sandwich domain
MEPGEELDLLVAEIVGWDRKHAVVECEDRWYSYCKNCGLTGAEALPAGSKRTWDTPCDTPPPYSTDIAAAWKVVEKLRLSLEPTEKGWACGRRNEECYFDVKETTAIIDGTIYDLAETPTAPHAICLAALRAVGITPRDSKP